MILNHLVAVLEACPLKDSIKELVRGFEEFSFTHEINNNTLVTDHYYLESLKIDTFYEFRKEALAHTRAYRSSPEGIQRDEAPRAKISSR